MFSFNLGLICMKLVLKTEDVLKYGTPERAIIVNFVEKKSEKIDFKIDKSKKSYAPIAIIEFKKVMPWVHTNTIKRHLAYLVKNKFLIRKKPNKKMREKINNNTEYVNGIPPRLYRAV